MPIIPDTKTYLYLILIFPLPIILIVEGVWLYVPVAVSCPLQARFEGVEWPEFSRFPNGRRHDI